jgi:hypothetical protein
MLFEAGTMAPTARDLQAADLMQALRGIWKLDDQMVVVEVDQERHSLIASTYEGEPLDPLPVLRNGTQVKAFAIHRNGGTHD